MHSKHSVNIGCCDEADNDDASALLIGCSGFSSCLRSDHSSSARPILQSPAQLGIVTGCRLHCPSLQTSQLVEAYLVSGERQGGAGTAPLGHVSFLPIEPPTLICLWQHDSSTGPSLTRLGSEPQRGSGQTPHCMKAVPPTVEAFSRWKEVSQCICSLSSKSQVKLCS